MYQEYVKNPPKRLFASYALIAYSFGGKFKGGYAGRKDHSYDYVAGAYRSALKQSHQLQGVQLHIKEYSQLDIPKNSIIYCDPPYKKTTGYVSSFDHEEFYLWCVQKQKEGHEVYISEYEMPSHLFECVWEKELVNKLKKKDSLDKRANKEKLFKVKEL